MREVPKKVARSLRNKRANPEFRHCTTKRAFLTLELAEAARVAAERTHYYAAELEGYLCRYCREFHLGHRHIA